MVGLYVKSYFLPSVSSLDSVLLPEMETPSTAGLCFWLTISAARTTVTSSLQPPFNACDCFSKALAKAFFDEQGVSHLRWLPFWQKEEEEEMISVLVISYRNHGSFPGNGYFHRLFWEFDLFFQKAFWNFPQPSSSGTCGNCGINILRATWLQRCNAAHVWM